MKKLTSGGGWPAIRYALKMATQSGGVFKLYRALRARNACKTCALGMGGQRGGMVDETGRFPEVCKKSMQAMAADLQGPIGADFFERYSLQQLRTFSSRELERSGRLTDPLYAGRDDTHYRRVSWDEAVSRCVEQFRSTPPEHSFFYVSGRSSNEAGFLLQLFARLYGTNNVNNCSYYCHQASGVALHDALGSGTATLVLEDLKHCDLFFLIGGNPSSNHPRLMRQMVDMRRRGGHIVVINPLREIGLVNFKVPSDLRSLLFGSEIATHYVQPHIGGDIALLTAIARCVEESGAINESFLERSTEDWPAYRDSIRRLKWGDLIAVCGVSGEEIKRIAQLYSNAKSAVFSWTMGITHHLHGVDNVHAIINLALVRGMVGRPGAGLLPIRGHSNVQGIGSMGVAPLLKKALYDRLQSHFGVTLPTSKGMDTLSCMEAMQRGEMKTGLCLGGNLFAANPDAGWAAAALARLDSITYLSTKLNTGHVQGRAKETIILPVLARDEEPQPTTQESMFNFVRLSDGGRNRLVGPRSEVRIIADLARGVLGEGGPIDWNALQNHGNLRRAIAAVVPGYEAISRIDETRDEFQIESRTFHEPHFATASGKAKFRVTQIPQRSTAGREVASGSASAERGPSSEHNGGELMLMTIRSEGQFNTVVYEDEDIYRAQERRDVILMNRADIERLGLRVDQRVTVRSTAGRMNHILVREFDIRAGNAAMYYPEANVLVPSAADPASRTPAFKAVPITLQMELDILP